VSNIRAKKKGGDFDGEYIFPHKYNDGAYVASSSKYDVDYIRVDIDELEALVKVGYGTRMSSPDILQPPSHIESKSIEISSPNPLLMVSLMLPRLINAVDLDIDSKSKSRKEQAFLRAHLANGKLIGVCTLCGNEFPVEMLIAAHIKNRSKCTDTEKRDFENVVTLMCKVGCDDLFEKGYVFVKDGEVVKNKKCLTTPSLDKVISEIEGNKVSNWIGSSKYYLWHELKF